MGEGAGWAHAVGWQAYALQPSASSPSPARSHSLPRAGELPAARCATLPVFNLQVPQTCSGVPPGLLKPGGTWVDASAHEAALRQLAATFVANFTKFEVRGVLAFSRSHETRRLPHTLPHSTPSAVR